MSKNVSLLVWGATGVTGRRVCHELAARYQNEVTWAIAGRSQAKLQDLRNELESVNTACKDLPIFVADIKDRDSVSSMVKQTDLVVACAGPFPLYSDVVVECCVEQGIHCFDVTSETLWARTIIDRFHKAAEKKNVKIVNFCGFGSVAAEIGALYLAKQVYKKYGRGITRMLGCHASKTAGQVKFSDGTFASLSNMFNSDPSQAKLQQDPYLLNPKDSIPEAKPLDHTGPEYDKDFKFWKAPFFGEAVDTRVIRRSMALKKDLYGKDFEYRECSKMNGYFDALKTSLGLALLSIFIKFFWSRHLFLKMGILLKPGEDAFVEDELKSKWELALYALVAPDPRNPDAKPIIAEAFVSDNFGGYTSTARMVVECAMCQILDSEKLKREGLLQGGVLTPAVAFGETLIDRLSKIGIAAQFLD